MFCPTCRSRFEDGVERCPDCGGPLLASPPVDPSAGPVALAPLLSTADIGFLPVVKSLLDAVEIPYVIQGEEALGLLPVGAFAGGVSPGALHATVHVPEDRLEEARALLEERAQEIKDDF